MLHPLVEPDKSYDRKGGGETSECADPEIGILRREGQSAECACGESYELQRGLEDGDNRVLEDQHPASLKEISTYVDNSRDVPYEPWGQKQSSSLGPQQRWPSGC